MSYVAQLSNQYHKTSMYDLMALSLAKQESCPLLTGDKALRDAAQKEVVLIKGTVWVLEQLVVHQKIVKNQAITALDIMKSKGRRLPFDYAKQIILNISV